MIYQFHVLISDESVTFRDKQNYEEDVAVGDQSLTGVKSNSVFNTLKFFMLPKT